LRKGDREGGVGREVKGSIALAPVSKLSLLEKELLGVKGMRGNLRSTYLMTAMFTGAVVVAR